VSWGFLDERPNRPPTVVITTGELSAPGWRWVAPVVITGLVLAPIVFAAAYFFVNRIEPAHRALGQPFTIAGITYRAVGVKVVNNALAVTITANSATQLEDCAGIAGFELDDAGQTYHAPLGGCFPLIPDNPDQRWIDGLYSPTYDRRDLWWFPSLGIEHRRWTVRYKRAPQFSDATLVVRATGGVHQFGNDRYAVIHLP
jgi:hypothetical protein